MAGLSDLIGISKANATNINDEDPWADYPELKKAYEETYGQPNKKTFVDRVQDRKRTLIDHVQDLYKNIIAKPSEEIKVDESKNLITSSQQKNDLAQRQKQEDLQKISQALGVGIAAPPSKEDDIANTGGTKDDLQKAAPLTISQMYPRGTDLIKLYESINKTGKPYLKAYKDKATNTWTIGFGNTIIDGSPVKEGDVITYEKAIQKFNNSTRESVDELNHLKSFLPKGIKFSHGFESALISLLHNSSTDDIKYTPKKRNETRAFKALKKGDLRAFSKELFDPKVGIVSAGGKIRKGLIDRRQKELTFLDPSERYDIKEEQKKSGGMIERNYYDYAPRNI